MATPLYTIGFTRSTAQHFFGRLRESGARRLVDVRLNNTSTLAGFSKRDDLAYFLRAILDVGYTHEPLLAPTSELLKAYQAKQIDWAAYAAQFNALLHERALATSLDRAAFRRPTVLLCSEATPEHCHRRLVAEHLSQSWGDLDVIHL